jgi:LmbE family N-acetylglucosaminyl deacetylase
VHDPLVARLRELNALWRYAHVVLSPHLDDAVLSLGSTIAALTTRGERVLIYTVCAGLPSPLDDLNPVAEELTGGSAHAWVQTRRLEDARAAELLGADYAFDTALDAIFRDPQRYAHWEQLFGTPDPSDSLHRHAFGTICLLAFHARDAKIYAPLGIGGHVDHQIVRDAALRAVPASRAPRPAERLYFYEDFPYVLQGRTRPFELDQVARPQVITRIKEEAIAAYESQIEMLFETPAKMKKAVRSQKKETLWRALSRRG